MQNRENIRTELISILAILLWYLLREITLETFHLDPKNLMRCTNLEERYCKTSLLLVYTLFYRVVVRTILQYTFMHPLVTVINTNSSKVVFKGTSLHFSGNSLNFTRGLILSVFAIFDKSLLTVYVVCPENVHCFPTFVQ